ncbi:MAG: efflux RND transporter permease subunit [Candidatus Omnitrophica bacterium]|nr:efflux RND transporter permease subunit [Candidatus Omnitrophota bacterium]MCB9721409.1 efflux RND transporter permease subunit [Candidatus Omnitrophota bacterium]
MKSVLRFFVRNHLVAVLFTLMIFVLGINALWGIKRDNYPNVDYAEMTITTVYPGASPEDVEINVTHKIEKELRSVTGLKDFVSVSMENSSNILVLIDPDTPDQDEVKMKVREAVNRVVDLPPEVDEAPFVEESNNAQIPIIEVGITSHTASYRELYDYARIFEKKLRGLDEVARVGKYGYRQREIQIEVFPHKIRQYETSLMEIIDAIRKRNIRSTAGKFESFTTERDIVTMAEFEDPMEVGEVIVRSSFDGPLVKINDLAVIKDDFEQPTTLSRINGRPAISFLIYKKESADIIRTAEMVKKLVQEVQPYTPEGLELSLAADYSRSVKNRFKVVMTNAAMGLAMVLVLLAMFLSVRAAFWVALGIPVSLLGTVFLLPLFGSFLDSITLCAMIMVIGIIVDDAIIVGENIYKYHQLGRIPEDSAVEGAAEVFWPVITTILTTLCAFAPMFFMPGVMGEFTKVVPLTISLALIVSLIEVTVALPSHLAGSLNKSFVMEERSWFGPFQRSFVRLLDGCLRYSFLVLIAMVLILAATGYVAVQRLNYVQFPATMSEAVRISAELPIGTPLQATARKMREIEEIVEELPPTELASYITRIGKDGYLGIESENKAYVNLTLTPFNDRARSAQRIVTALRTRTDTLQGYDDINFTIDTGGLPGGDPIHLFVVGHDDEQRAALTEGIVSFLQSVDGVSDIKRGDPLGKDQIKLVPDYERLARLGLTVEDVARNARVAVDGQLVTSVRYENEDVDFRVINDEKSRQNPNYLEELLIPNRQGKLIRLDQAVRFERKQGYAHFQHYDGERTVEIKADVNKDIIAPSQVMARLKENFNIDRDWPGMRLVEAGELYETSKSVDSLQRTFVVAVIAIYCLLVLLFRSVLQPLIVLLAIPFGLVGVVWALFLHGQPLSFMGMLGIIGLSGVVVNDSLVLVNHINNLRRDQPGKTVREIVLQGASDRLRAIIMTTLTTVVGMLPLAYGLGGADPFVAPMALTLGFGLLLATPLTLIVIPCLYLVGAAVGRAVTGRRNKYVDISV